MNKKQETGTAICYICKKEVKPEDAVRYYGGINHRSCRDRDRERRFGKREQG